VVLVDSNVNKVETHNCLKHIPSGISRTSQQERSQLQNELLVEMLSKTLSTVEKRNAAKR
jgi:protein subunit release factor B